MSAAEAAASAAVRKEPELQPGHEQYRRRVRRWAAEANAESRRIGTLRHIDDDARRRAVRSLATGQAISLADPMRGYEPQSGFPDVPPGQAMFSHTCRIDSAPTVPFGYFAKRNWAIGNDHIDFEVHGHLTHVDGFGHIIIDGTTHGGRSIEESEHSVADFAEFGIFTRAVFADIPSLRGTDWVEATDPVTGDELDHAVAMAGITFMPGDALLVYMGRDRYEQEHPPAEFLAEYRPGIGMSGAEWIADHEVAVLCWDFVDANHPDEPRMSVHVLVWALGLVLVDSCNFTAAAQASRASRRNVGALALAPLRIPGATGSPVNPLWVM